MKTQQAPKIKLVQSTRPTTNNKSLIEKPADLITPEMVIGLCCPIGSPAAEIAEQIKNQLFREYDYQTEVIKLSKTISDISNSYFVEEEDQKTKTKVKRFWIQDHISAEMAKHEAQTEAFKKKKRLIIAGNKIRSDFQSLSPLASHAVKEINEARINNIEHVIDELEIDNKKKEELKSEIKAALDNVESLDRLDDSHQAILKKAFIRPTRTCFIIDSLKNKEELNLLRETYGRSFFLVGVSASIEDRKTNLTSDGMTIAEFEMLVSQDTGEDIEEGQNVSDIFCESDYFMRVDHNETSRREKVSKMLSILFDSSLVTPNRHETAMYQAASAAGNSACMSRQVGASITDELGELVSVGWNDVPRFGGNLYRTTNRIIGALGQPIELTDNRCYNWGGRDCHNDLEKDTNAGIIAKDLFESGIIPFENETDKDAKILEVTKTIRNHPKFRGLIEFSRSIHAEMHAILSADRSKLISSSLYCTTYPCHSCARHIVAAGVKEVFYIEPYRKSLAIKLHKDSITDEGKLEKVQINIFEGVAPRRYMDLFKNPNNHLRKENGKLREIDNKVSSPSICQTTLASVSALEHVVINSLQNKETRLRAKTLID
ncbi:MAG: deoxycytidylate deaminase [Porticoccaceae bacterium]|jgi:deoxycytidylate deaminase